jgi:hypothetical protein
MKRFCRAAQLVAFAGLSACAAEPTGEIDTALDAQALVTASELGSGEFVIAAGEGWIPFEYRKAVEPGSALDFSKLAHRHAPAGKFGRVVAKGVHERLRPLRTGRARDLNVVGAVRGTRTAQVKERADEPNELAVGANLA